MKAAGIDIGTNTILMAIGECAGGEWTILRDEHSIARLGEGVDASRTIRLEAIARATAILECYRKICDEEKVDSIRIASTSALRDAANREAVVGAFSKIMRAPVHVISGEEEARLSFLGTVPNGDEAMVIDIGGGSTEIITGACGAVTKRHSTPLGAVRLTERFLKNSPPSEAEVLAAKDFICEEIQKTGFGQFAGTVYAVAGTATTVAAVARGEKGYSRDSIHGYALSARKLGEVLSGFLSMSSSEIASRFGIDPLRADVITAGCLVLAGIFESLGLRQATVSTEGLRYGIMKHMEE